MEMLTFVAFVTLVIITVDGQSSGTFQIPIRRNETGAEALFRKGKFEELARIHRLAAIGQQQLTDYYDSEYIGPITTYPILMDTGSSDLWIAAGKCTDCIGMSPFYNITSSSTASNIGTTWSIQYGSGSATGTLVKDIVCIGSLCYATQTFGQATSVDSSFQNSGFSGLLGLGWPSLSAENAVPFVQNILPQLSSQLFTVWLNSVGAQSQTQETTYGGMITFGGLDTTHCSSTVNYVPLTSLSYWQFAMASVAMGSYSVSGPWQVISDTGTSLIYGPTAIVAQLAAQVGASSSNGLYMMPCTGNYPSVVLTIGGHAYTIPASIYIYAYNGATCMFGFQPSSGSLWILGDPFIRSYCNVYNVGAQQIGFAQALNNGQATTPIVKPTTNPTCTHCGNFTVAPTSVSGTVNGISSLTYGTSASGCTTVAMTCLNSVFNASSAIYGYYVNSYIYQISTELNPNASTASFVCLPNGTYLSTIWNLVFPYVVCTVPTSSQNCSHCGNFIVAPTSVSGTVNGISSLTYGTSASGCTTVAMTCLNSVFNASSAIYGYYVNSYIYQISTHLDPTASTASFVCLPNGTYLSTLWNLVFPYVVCTVPTSSQTATTSTPKPTTTIKTTTNICQSSSWSAWSTATCSASCGACGVMTQTRTCTPAGCTCSGNSTLSTTTVCNYNSCPSPQSACCSGYTATSVASGTCSMSVCVR